MDEKRYRFVKGDVCDKDIVDEAVSKCDTVVHFAAETHVDRSIMYAGDFVTTDVFGTFVLLEAARKYKVEKFVHISTDEVYGEAVDRPSRETDALMPKSPYAASKAGADRLAFSYYCTYGLPVTITRCTNNYGPYQYPEKLIPLFVTNALDDEPLPLYGDGKNVRDWLYVEDHAEAIDFLLDHGAPGETYNIAGGNEMENIEITRRVLAELGKPESLIRYVDDRPGHDRRYSLDAGKLARAGFQPRTAIADGLSRTIRWYRDRPDWWRPIKEKDAAFRAFYRTQYGDRLATSTATAKQPG
jgi:dTDP-glucose 4,6-dehydratase